MTSDGLVVASVLYSRQHVLVWAMYCHKLKNTDKCHTSYH